MEFDMLMRSLAFRKSPLRDVLRTACQKSVIAALKLGVFEALENNAMTSSDLAMHLHSDQLAINSLLTMLKRAGSVERKGSRYSNSSSTSKWLVHRSHSCVSNYLIMWNDLALKFWDENMEQAIVKGKSDQSFYDWLYGQPRINSEKFQLAMAELANITSDEILREIFLPSDASKLLDIGGGEGHYSLKFCEKYQSLGATVIDLPSAFLQANKTKPPSGKDRIFFHSGDYLLEELGSEYNVALLFNILHAHSSDQNISLLKKVVRALDKDGIVAVLDIFGEKSFSNVLNPLYEFFDFTFLISFGHQLHGMNEVENWLLEAGFCQIERRSLRAMPGLRLLTGKKK